MKFLVLALVGCLTVFEASAGKNKLNDLVDEVIWEMEQDMIKQDTTVVKMSDVDQTFSKKVLFFSVNGSFKMTGPSVQNLSTIYRVADVTETQDDATGSMTISSTFAMKDLTLKADDFDFKIGFVHINDPLSVTVGKNAASFAATLTYDENLECKASLSSVSVSQLGDFKITLGSGLLTDLEDDIANYVLNKLAPTIQNAINAHIFPIASNAIDKLDLCKKLPF